MSVTRVNLFIVGAAKSGTTSLVDFLNRQPGFFFSTLKEPFFFVKNYGLDNLGDYHHLYRNAFGKYDYIGDASTGYLFDSGAANRIFHYNSDSKIVILLRNPLKAAVSLWRYMRVNGDENLDFEEAINEERSREKKGGLSNWLPNYMYSRRYLYSDQITSYFDVFPRESIHVIIFERLLSNQKEELTALAGFLGTKYEGTVIPFSNQGGDVRNDFLRKIKNAKYPFLKKFIPIEMRNRLRVVFRDLATIKNSDIASVTVPGWYKNSIENDVAKLRLILNDDIKEWEL